MTTETKTGQEKPAAEERPIRHWRAAPEELARLLAAAPPFDAAAWQRGAVPPTPEELADMDDFLRELDEMRQHDLKRQEERLADLSE